MFLELAWPPGSIVDLEGAADSAVRTCGRDPDGHFDHLTSARYAPDVAVLPTAVETGFFRWGNRLAVDPAGETYVKRFGGSTERWPLITAAPGCD